MPPAKVAKANPWREFFQNVAIEEVVGTPEFRWFDGGAVLTTRPTRKQVLKDLRAHLDRADFLAPSRIDAEYMLYVNFDELRGPNVWFGTDKLSSAHITFRLVRWRTNQLVKEKTIEASYRAKWAGVTPEIARAAIAGPIGVADDSPFRPVGGVLGGLVVGYYVNENLVVRIYDTRLAGVLGAYQAAEIGGPGRASDGYWAAVASALAVGTARGRFTDFEAMLAGGLISGAGAAMGPVEVSRPISVGSEIGAFDGTARRYAATHGLLDLAFDEFMSDLAHDGSVVYKTAVSCQSLNPYGTSIAVTRETDAAYAIDCPGSKYNESKATRVYPSRF